MNHVCDFFLFLILQDVGDMEKEIESRISINVKAQTDKYFHASINRCFVHR